MPRRPSPLPHELTFAPFLSRDAGAVGVPDGRLRARDLTSPFHGVRARRGEPDDATLARCALYAPRLGPAQFFSHTTAAELWGIPLPSRVRGGLLHVGACAPAREPRTVGVIGHRLRIGFEQLTLVHGMAVPTPSEVIAQLASTVRSRIDRARGAASPGLAPDDLVIAIDDVRTRGLSSVEELSDASARWRRRGAVDLERAIADSRDGAESPKETEVRLMLVRAGLPEPELNWELHTSSGMFVARLDLAYPRWKAAVEYDGRQHAESIGQFERDADRWAAIGREGWVLVRILAHHMRTPRTAVVDPVRRALAARGWSPRG